MAKYAEHADHMFKTAEKHLGAGKSTEFKRGFAAGMLAAADNTDYAATLDFADVNDAKQFGRDAAKDMRAKASAVSGH